MNAFNTFLIFAATGMFCFLTIHLICRYLLEKLEFRVSPIYDELKRFISPDRLLMLRIFSTLITACAAFLVQLAGGVEKMVIALPVSCGFAIAAWILVLRYYQWKLAKRKEAFETKILDFTMALTNSMKSGLALGQAVEAVSRRIGGPMQEELVILLREHHLGVDLPEAFERMYKRMPCEDMHLLVTTITLTTRSGGSLVEVLNEMVDTIRARTEFQERLKNMTAQGRFEAISISAAPLAAFILLYCIDPVLMKPLVTTGSGWLAVGVASILVSIGYSILKRIITVEV